MTHKIVQNSPDKLTLKENAIYCRILQSLNFNNPAIVYVNPQSSELLQLKLFELGYAWGISEKVVQHTDKPYLSIRDRGFYFLEDIANFDPDFVNFVNFNIIRS